MLSYTALALASVAAVSALPTPREEGLRIPISMSKRAGIRNAIKQGTFNAEKGQYYVDQLVGKYQSTLDAYVESTGAEHPLAKGTRAERSLLAKRQAEPLTDEEKGSFWQGNIKIGGQTIPVDFDTGSSDLWVPGSSCTSKGCQKATAKYNPAKSSTAKEVSASGFKISYGDGSSASGPEYTDTVTVGGLSATTQKFSPVTQDTIQQGTGILGMGWQSISSLKSAPFFFTLVNEKKVKSGVFSMALKATGAELYLGGTDSSLYTGDITYTDLTHESYWATTGSMTAGGKAALSDIPMIIDSGTSLLVGTEAQAEKFYAAIGGKKCTDSSCSGYYEYPCDAKVAFSMNGATFDVSSTFSLGSLSGNYNGNCVGALVGTSEVPLNAMIVGDTFFQNSYVVFDTENKRVGYAQLA